MGDSRETSWGGLRGTLKGWLEGDLKGGRATEEASPNFPDGMVRDKCL